MKKFTKAIALFLVLVIPLLSCAVFGIGNDEKASEIVYFSENFENGITGWKPYVDNKVPFGIEAKTAETNALTFGFAYNPSVSYDWNAFPIVSSPNYNIKVEEATHLAFDFYLDADAASAASGSMQITPVLQSPEHSYWFMLTPKSILFSAGEKVGGLIKYSASFELTDTDGNELSASDTIQNFVFVTSGVATDYSGRAYYDNIRLISYGKNELSISKVTVKNPYTLKPGTTAEISCTAKGGTPPYSYAFYILKDGKAFYESAGWSSSPSISYTPQTSGDYTLLAYCKDADGKQANSKTSLKIYEESEIVPADKLIALTFDDGPDSNAGELLDILDEKDVKVTFYVTHVYAQYSTGLLKRIAQDEHQIGNHTLSHDYLTKLSESEARAEIEDNAEFIQSVTGIYPKTFRPPYLDYNAQLLSYFPDQTAIGCSIDSRDWTGNSVDEIISNVTANAKDGDIVLMHEPQANTRAAIGRIIDLLRGEGFEFVTVDELFRRQNVPMSGGKYYSRVNHQAPAVENPLKAAELISEFNLGWNLGNTLDSHGEWIGTMQDPSKYETAWGNPLTTKAMIDAVKEAGFKAIRVPTTWYQHIDTSGKIDPVWMARVKEIVDYGINNDLYVILNLHHEDDWLSLDDSAAYQTILTQLQSIWTQIAFEFADYDQHLIFEVLNEPRNIGATDEWIGRQSSCMLLNRLNSAALKAIRTTGGKNLTRCVMLPTYAAGVSELALSCMEVPSDPYTVISVHAYTPYNFCTDAAQEYTTAVENDLKRMFKLLEDFKQAHENVPVILGEFGCYPKNNPSDRISWVNTYVSAAKALGIPCFIWDDGSSKYGLLERGSCTWNDKEYLDALLSASGL